MEYFDFAGPGNDIEWNGIKVVLGVIGHVGSLGQVLAQQPIGVLV